MVVEHRLDAQALDAIRPKLKSMHRNVFCDLALRTGAHKLAISGGQMALPQAHLHTFKVDPELLSEVGYEETGSRWTSFVLRTKSVSILIVLVYFRTAEGLSEANAAILSQIGALAAKFAGPAIVGGAGGRVHRREAAPGQG